MLATAHGKARHINIGEKNTIKSHIFLQYLHFFVTLHFRCNDSYIYQTCPLPVVLEHFWHCYWKQG